jgi:hypothetical protein
MPPVGSRAPKIVDAVVACPPQPRAFLAMRGIELNRLSVYGVIAFDAAS